MVLEMSGLLMFWSFSISITSGFGGNGRKAPTIQAIVCSKLLMRKPIGSEMSYRANVPIGKMKPVINITIKRSLRLLNTLPPEDQSTEAGSEKNFELLVALLSLFRCGDRMLDDGLKRRRKELYIRVSSLPSSGSG
jgi:hypothetical protein